MTDLSLPKLVASAAPEFVDAAACKAWLENVPLANVAAAQHQLRTQVEEFNRFPAAAANRLSVMETLREPVNFVQIEQAKRFTNRALPMADAETEVFDDTIALWGEMELGYLRCLEAALQGDAALRAQAAMVCQRVLAYCGLRMFHHYRAYREVPAAGWRALHQAYVRAETLGVAEEAVKDFLNRDVHATSPRIAYLRAVLMGMCNPNELAQRQLTFVAFLLERWAEKVDASKEPVAEEKDLPPLVADLAGERCPERAEKAEAKEPRYLDVKRLAKSLRNRIGLLRKGESPAKLALGEDCVQPSCEQLLVFLYRQWCQAKAGRSSERRSVTSKAQASNEFAAIHYYISGEVFRQPAEGRVLSRQESEQIATLGRIATGTDDLHSAGQGFVLEEWQLGEESVAGLRMLRAAGNQGKRYVHGQLVAVRPGDAKNFQLGQVRWLMQGENGDLHAGIRLMPGLPAATAVRATGLNAANVKYVQALSLSAVPTLSAPPSLVLPTGWYKPKRVVEAFVERAAVRLQLSELVERGSDFERISYEIAG